MEKEKLVIAKVSDKIKSYNNTGICTGTFFLDLGEQQDIEYILRNIPYSFFGGYDDAERKILIIGECENKNEFLKVITIESKNELAHRSVLGSILNLGIKRDTIGDIIVYGNSSDIIVVSEMSEFLLSNFKKVGRDNVTTKEKSIEDLITIKKDPKIIKTTVASLRLDAIISSSLGISREVASEIIKDGNVSLNYKVTESLTKQVKENDMISVRHYGRIQVGEILGETKKNRIRVTLYKW